MRVSRPLNDYSKVFEQWLSDGIIEKVESNGVEGHYLPHRPVLKLSSTTPIRPVFDASAKSKDGISLNACLEVGPNLIELIPSSINRFREYDTGIVSDIAKAFLQIVVSPKHRDFLRFLWIINNQVVVFRHVRLAFGLSCSPFILGVIIELILQVAEQRLINRKKVGWSQKTLEKLKKAFYFDNF